MRTIKASFAALGLAALSSGCTSAPSPPMTSDSLVGSSWQVVGLNGGSVYSLDMTIAFDPDGQAVGNASCHTYSSSYRLDGKQLTFGNPVIADRFCDHDLMEFEERFLATLGDVDHAAIAPSGSLVLYARDGKRIVARPVTAAPPSAA